MRSFYSHTLKTFPQYIKKSVCSLCVCVCVCCINIKQKEASEWQWTFSITTVESMHTQSAERQWGRNEREREREREAMIQPNLKHHHGEGNHSAFTTDSFKTTPNLVISNVWILISNWIVSLHQLENAANWWIWIRKQRLACLSD